MRVELIEARDLLAGLRTGDAVSLTHDGKVSDLTVTRELRRMDGGGFGSVEHSAVTVGYGPGRWNVEVTPMSLIDGRFALTRREP